MFKRRDCDKALCGWQTGLIISLYACGFSMLNSLSYRSRRKNKQNMPMGKILSKVQ